VALLGLCAVNASAQDWAKAALAKSPRHGEYVTIQEPSGRSLQAFVVYPEISTKAPVVVLIHEIFGESDWFKLMADDLAAAGYIAIAPDLLSGYGAAPAAGAKPMAMPMSMPMPMSGMGCDPMACAPGQKPLLRQIAATEPMDHDMQAMRQGTGAPFVPVLPGGTTAFPPDQVTRAVMALPDAEVLADLDAAADYGKKLPAASGKLFVAGFCWGGGKSFLFATHRKDLSAAFVFYGTPPAADLMKNITAPVYGFYAGNDARVSATIPQATAEMKAAGKVYEPVVYDGAGHGFMRAGEAPDASAANAAARAEAFKRMVKLLGGVR
jgi:carboxymethylenebutenolidase